MSTSKKIKKQTVVEIYSYTVAVRRYRLKNEI
jgi:hypothetical protein